MLHKCLRIAAKRYLPQCCHRQQTTQRVERLFLQNRILFIVIGLQPFHEARQERKKQELLQANARAQVGASGVAMAGSPSDVLIANAREGELDIRAIQYGSQIRQNNLRTQADISRFSGKQAMAGGIINAQGL